MRTRSLLALLVVAVSMAALPSARAASPTSGGFVIRCDYSHTSPDDPIVFPGQPGASHMHDFFGNESTEANSTYQSMIYSVSNCAVPTDTAGYWAPTPFFNGLEFHPDGRGSDMRIYYQANGATAMETIPPDLRMIAGNKLATEPPSTNVLRWYCGAGPGGKTPFSDHPYDCTDLARQYKFVDGVVGVIDMPRCWDGTGLSPADVVPPVSGTGTDCPDGFGHLLPQVSERVHFGIMDPCGSARPCGPDDSDENVVLSFSSGPYYTFHADFWNTWNQGTLDTLTADCLNAHVGCGFLSDPYTLSTSTTGTGLGTITSSPSGIACGSTCSADYLTATHVDLSATPEPGSVFEGWGGDCSGADGCTVAMEKDHTVQAKFVPTDGSQFSLTVVRNGEGTGTVSSSPGGIDCGDTCRADFAGGSGVNLRATPAPGMLFTGWGGACRGTGACNVIMRTDLKAVAFFQPIVHRPDALIRTARHVSFVGDDVYSRSGAGQTAVVRATRGSTVAFVIRAENDGNAVDSFDVKGTGDVRKFSARYLAAISGNSTITGWVRAGRYTLSDVHPGGVGYIRLWVHVPKKVPAGATATWFISVRSTGVRDAVRARVRVVRH